ncbi:MAG: hypothetical protein ACK4PK_01445 [Alphaproteobacteria bacterium]
MKSIRLVNKADKVIIPIAAVERVDISRIEQDGTVDICIAAGSA